MGVTYQVHSDSYHHGCYTGEAIARESGPGAKARAIAFAAKLHGGFVTRHVGERQTD